MRTRRSCSPTQVNSACAHSRACAIGTVWNTSSPMNRLRKKRYKRCRSAASISSSDNCIFADSRQACHCMLSGNPLLPSVARDGGWEVNRHNSLPYLVLVGDLVIGRGYVLGPRVIDEYERVYFPEGGGTTYTTEGETYDLHKSCFVLTKAE